MRLSKRGSAGALLIAVLAVTTFHGSLAQYANVSEAATDLGLTSLLTTVEAANITAEVLNFEGVILAPTNEAWRALLAALGATTPDDVPSETLTAVLQYHLLPNATALQRSTFPTTIPTALAGQAVTYLTTGEDGTTYVGGVAPGTTITLAEDPNEAVTAGNAVLYVIDTVLLPPLAGTTVPYPTLASALASSNALTSLATLVVADEEVLALLSDPNTMVTVFAPTNDAFAATLAALNTTLEEVVGTPTASLILKTHVIPSRPYLAAQLPSGTTADVATAADGQALTLTVTGGAVGAAAGGNTAPVDVILADVKAGKSVVHVVDGVLVPEGLAVGPAPSDNTTLTQLIAENPELSTLSRAIDATGLAATLDDPDFTGVILAPTNDAFDASLAALGLSLSQLVASPDALDAILRYHVIPLASDGTAPPELEPSPTPITLPSSLRGQDITYVTSSVPDVQRGTTYFGGVSPGVVANLSTPLSTQAASLYTIDRILLPPLPTVTVTHTTVAAALAAVPQLSTLAALVKADEELSTLLSDPDAFVTVFTPTNRALATFLTAFNTTPEEVAGTELGGRILRTHVVPLPIATAAFPQGASTLPTLSDLDTLEVEVNSPTVLVAGPGNLVTPAAVTTRNLVAGKAVIHVIDTVLRPDVPALVEEPPADSVLDAVLAAGATAFAEAVAHAGLSDTLADPQLLGVVLVPDNSAFAALLAALNATNVTELAPSLVADLVGYHIVPSTDANTTLLPTEAPLTLATLAGVDLTYVSIAPAASGDGGLAYVGGVAPGALLNLSQPLAAGQATMYTISGVVVPPVVNLTTSYQSVGAAVADLGSSPSSPLTTLAALVAADKEVAAVLADPDALITLFAPNDEAFESLFTALNVTLEEVAGTEVARKILEAHVVVGRPLLASQLGAEEDVAARSLGGGEVVLSYSNDTLTVRSPASPAPAPLLTPDTGAGKGVVHVIGGVLLPAGLHPGVQYDTVMDAVEALGLTLLYDALYRTNMTTVLEDPALRAILFLPDNTAINATLGGGYITPRWMNLVEEVPDDLMAALLAYHVVLTAEASPELVVPATRPLLLPTLLEGANLTVESLPSARAYVGGVAPGGVIDLDAPIRAGNATIYLVSGLLLPPVVNTTVPAPTPAAALAARAASGLSLINALVAADEVVAALLADPNLAATIFVPSDTVITATLAYLGSSPAALLGTQAARAILAEHIMTQRPYLASQFPAGTTTGLTTLGGGTGGLKVVAGATGVSVQGRGNPSPARITTADIRGGKSVIHVVDFMLLPANVSVPPSNSTRGPGSTGSDATPNAAGTATSPRALALTTLAGALLLLLGVMLG